MTQLTRRRFLALSAAMAATPAQAMPVRWSGHALGAEISLTLRAPQDIAQRAITQAIRHIRQVEAAFSLYDPASELTQLNQTGQLSPSPIFADLMAQVDRVHRLTMGRFDPTVQPLYLDRHTDQAARHPVPEHVGWTKINRQAGKITLRKGQALTFNGIAQGYATDRVTAALKALGLTDILVNIGEHAALGGPWRLSLVDPKQGHLGTRTLHSGAIATSSPQPSPSDTHILHPRYSPRWSTVSVEASHATLADGLSTGLCLADLPMIENVAQNAAVKRVTLVDATGNLRTFENASTKT